MKEKEKGCGSGCSLQIVSLNPQLLLPLGPSPFKISILEAKLSRIYCPETAFFVFRSKLSLMYK